MKLNFSSRLKVLASGSISDYISDFISGNDIVNLKDIDKDTALKYSAVHACIRVRAETFASLPAMLYQKNKDGREEKDDIEIYDILHNRPNDEMSAFNFKEVLSVHHDLYGNAICQRLFNKSDEFIGLYPLRNVDIKRNDEKKLEYEVPTKDGTETLTRDKVLHIPNLSYDGINGLSPISYAAQAIKLGQAYEQYGVKYFNNAATPSGVLETDSVLDDKSFKRLKKDMSKSYSGLTNSGAPMILESGLKWKSLSFSPADAQLIESKYFQIEDICRIYRVPQHMINKLDRSTNNNIEHQSLEFVMYCMLPICKRFEDNINSQLITREQRKKGYYIEFKLDGLLRGDAKSRAEAYAVGRQWGWLSVNDIRRLENLSNIGAKGDIYLTPLNMADAGNPVDKTVKNYAQILDDIKNILDERR